MFGAVLNSVRAGLTNKSLVIVMNNTTTSKVVMEQNFESDDFGESDAMMLILGFALKSTINVELHQLTASSKW